MQTLSPPGNRNGQHPAALAADAYVPPQNIEAEQSTLGAMLIETAAVEKAVKVLGAADFYRLAHQVLFSVITTLYADGKPTDLITVQAELQRRGQLADAGGLDYLLPLFDTVPTAANVEHYAKIVKDKSGLRAMLTFGEQLAAAARHTDADTSSLIQKAEKMLARVSERTGQAAGKDFSQRIITLQDVPAPPAELPYLFGPYLIIGAAHWLTGQTGIGKSTFLYNVLPALAEGRDLWGISCQPTRILYLDMESGDVGRSIKAQRLFQDRAERAGLANLRFLRDALRLPEELPALLKYVQEEGIGLVVFDTARRCFSVDDENNNAEVYKRVIPTLDALKSVGVASLTLGHPAKNGNGSARGAGAQEDAGDVNLSLVMHKGEKDDPNGIIAVKVTKNRLLGLEIAPLLLQRTGNDAFERVDGAGLDYETPARQSAKERAAQFIVQRLASAETPLSYTVLEKAALAQQHSESTFKKALQALKGEQSIAGNEQGYSLIETDADGDNPCGFPV